MALLTTPIWQFEDSLGIPWAFAEAYFTATGTTTPVTVYEDDNYSSPYPSPVVADDEGRFPAIYANPSLGPLRMRMIQTGGDLGSPELDVDPIDAGLVLGGVTNTFLAPMPANTFKANLTGASAAPDDFGPDEVTDALRYSSETEQGVIVLASVAEALAGLVTDKAVTPAGLLATIAGAAPPAEVDDFIGKYTFASGLTIQWGKTGLIASDSFAAITFATPFTDLYTFIHSPSFGGAAYGRRHESWSFGSYDDYSPTGVIVYCASSYGALPIYIHWLAIGLV